MHQKVPNLTVRNGIFESRIQIPADVRVAYGKSVEQVSHGTRDFLTALAAHEETQRAVRARIALLRSGQAAAAQPKRPDWTPEKALAAIGAWERKETERRYLDAFYGRTPRFNFLDPEISRLQELVKSLDGRRWWEVPGFLEELVSAMAGEGIALTPDDPAIASLERPFGEALARVSRQTLLFGERDFSQWPPSGRQKARSGASRQQEEPQEGGAPRLSVLLETFIAHSSMPSKDASEMRGYVKRLIEHLGDIPADTVTTIALDGFLSRLRQFPHTRRPEILRLPFDEIVDKHGGEDADVLSTKTIRIKWFGAYNRLFKYAVSRELVARNPVTPALPSKKADQTRDREPWSGEQIAAMFARPLFTGCASLHGYRDSPGYLIAHDAKFWLPLIALFSGMRLDEPGAALAEEVKLEDGVWYFDLRGRPLSGARRVKNAQSRRVVPVHPVLIELGFIEYAQAQDQWLFPDLQHNGRQRTATSAISKWFGHWRKANGFHDPARMQDHHSFRHSFKDACRAAGLSEDLHDRLTGHAGSANQQISRGYGAGWSVKALGEAMSKVEFPTFPLAELKPFPVAS
ncbi:DUF6538 domain-containing protein [Caulobacter sp. KR2-114]|uniref:DUF6538 domain-containing protein n=1 Tax=Caulobacter sp. KR2-114 TaxID=3400912 RepID=UPI003C003346